MFSPSASLRGWYSSPRQAAGYSARENKNSSFFCSKPPVVVLSYFRNLYIALPYRNRNRSLQFTAKLFTASCSLLCVNSGQFASQIKEVLSRSERFLDNGFPSPAPEQVRCGVNSARKTFKALESKTKGPYFRELIITISKE